MQCLHTTLTRPARRSCNPEDVLTKEDWQCLFTNFLACVDNVHELLVAVTRRTVMSSISWVVKVDRKIKGKDKLINGISNFRWDDFKEVACLCGLCVRLRLTMDNKSRSWNRRGGLIHHGR